MDRKQLIEKLTAARAALVAEFEALVAKVHGEDRKAASIDLKAGEHPFTVTYFEDAGGEALRVQWQGPGFNRQPIPTGCHRER